MRTLLLLGLFLSCLQQVLMTQYDVDVSTESLQLLESCGNENGITVNDLYRIAHLHLDEQETPENVKCTVKCVLFDKGLVDEHGRLQNCSNVDGDSPCQRAFNSYRCLRT